MGLSVTENAFFQCTEKYERLLKHVLAARPSPKCNMGSFLPQDTVHFPAKWWPGHGHVIHVWPKEPEESLPGDSGEDSSPHSDENQRQSSFFFPHLGRGKDMRPPVLAASPNKREKPKKN